MELFLKPSYSIDDADAPVDSTKNWQCTVLSVAAHALFLAVAIYCMPVSALHQKEPPKEEIIMVKMISPSFDGSISSGNSPGIQSSDSAAAHPLPQSPPAARAAENPKPVKLTAVRPKPVLIKPSNPETTPAPPPEPDPAPENMTSASRLAENPQVETGAASSDSGISGSGTGSSGTGNNSGGQAGSLLGHGSGSGLGSGTGSGTVESAFGSAGGPRFVQRAMPRYPRRAQSQGKESTVVLRLTVDHTGRLMHVEVVSGAGNGFDEEAVRAIQKSTFSPAERNGRPVNCLALLSIRFQLESKD